MNDFNESLEDLSPEKRRLLELLLAGDHLTRSSQSAYEEPQTEMEQKLAEIWSSVLGIKKVGRHDNYFELGGDSIQCIQIMTKARRAGIRISTAQLFEKPTVAGLASVAQTETSGSVSQVAREGRVPLTPVQRWFFTLDVPNRNHWNQAMLLEVVAGLSPEGVRHAVQQVWNTHDVLRSRFLAVDSCWEQEIAPPGQDAEFRTVDIRNLDERETARKIDEETKRTNRGLSLADGPVAAAVYFDAGTLPGRLLFVAHHLVADAISFRIVAEDLNSIMAGHATEESPGMLERTTSWREWSLALNSYAQSDRVKQQRTYWDQRRTRKQSLPRDYSDGTNREEDTGIHTTILPADQTTALFQRTLSELRADINEVLATALIRSVGPWTREPELTFDLEGHGRENIGEDFDISRTAGWFTTIYPVRVPSVESDWRASLRIVKQVLRGVPDRGFGYGVLRYLSGVGPLPEAHPPVAMNYLGIFDRVLPPDSIIQLTGLDPGHLYDPEATRPYELQVVSRVTGAQLVTNWIYSQRLHSSSTIASLAAIHLQTLQQMIEQSGANMEAVLTPADFPDANLSQLELEQILKR